MTNGTQSNYIMYKGDEWSDYLPCSGCGEYCTDEQWWWTPKDNDFIVCQYCIVNFETRDEWPKRDADGKFILSEQLSFWD